MLLTPFASLLDTRAVKRIHMPSRSSCKEILIVIHNLLLLTWASKVRRVWREVADQVMTLTLRIATASMQFICNLGFFL